MLLLEAIALAEHALPSAYAFSVGALIVDAHGTRLARGLHPPAGSARPRRGGRPGGARPRLAGLRGRHALQLPRTVQRPRVAAHELHRPHPRRRDPAGGVRLARARAVRPRRGRREAARRRAWRWWSSPSSPTPPATSTCTSRSDSPQRRRYPSWGVHPDVDAVPAHPPRRPGRCRGAEPQAARPRGLRPPRRPGHLLVAAARAEGAAARRGRGARGDGRHRRPGDPPARAAAARALRGHRPLDRVRAQHLPAQGPQGRRLPARSHPRGAVHPARQGGVQLLPGLPGDPLPDPDEVPRRGAAAGGHPARARVPDEGLLLVRPHRRGPQRVLPAPPRRLREDLRPARAEVRDRRRDVGSDGRFGVGGVPRGRRDRRGHVRAEPGRLRGQRGGGHHDPAPRAVARRAAGRPGAPHAEHARRSRRSSTSSTARASAAPSPPPTP